MESNREKVVVIIATIMFFGAFGLILTLDDSHSEIGDGLEAENVNVNIIENIGNLKDAKIPEGLLIYGAGQDVSLDFNVINRDPDNDIDTIKITIPESELKNGSTEWYEKEFIHEWSFEKTETDSATFTAKDDWFGRVIGGSAQYDVVGNIDDALDYFEVNNTIHEEISEGITITLDFKTPMSPGMRMGENGIDLSVGDLKTEGTSGDLNSIYPFPYPYIVAENGSKYIVMILDNEDCDLEVMYGDKQLFTPTRAGDFLTSSYGYKYITNNGKTVAVLDEPVDELVTPLVKARSNNLTGQFTLDIFNITVNDIINNEFEINDIVSGYTDDVPSSTNMIIDNDLDNDGILNNLDDDMDGDGIPNQNDVFPKIFNRPPVIISMTENITIIEGEALTLSVEATDPDDETLFYLWTHDKDSTWNATGDSITLSDLDPGIYTFNVAITDELGNTNIDSVVVTVLENQAPVIVSISSTSNKIKEGDDVTLNVVATDNENDPLTYTWENSEDPAYERSGSEITVSDLKKGTYTFTVTVSDGRSEVQDSVTVTVEKDEDQNPIWPIILVIVAFILIVAITAIILVVRKKDNEDEEIETSESILEPEPGQPDDIPDIRNQQESHYTSTIEQEQTSYETQPLLMNEELEIPITDIEDISIPVENESNIEKKQNDDVIYDSNCPECGTELSDTDTKCPTCGMEFELDVECPICGEISPLGTQSCPLCGGTL